MASHSTLHLQLGCLTLERIKLQQALNVLLRFKSVLESEQSLCCVEAAAAGRTRKHYAVTATISLGGVYPLKSPFF